MSDRYRDLIDRFLDKIAGDPAFRRQLREDPYLALESSGFARQLEQLQPEGPLAADVMGYGACVDTCFNQWSCLSGSCYVTI
jgi:hypothetical protein